MNNHLSDDQIRAAFRELGEPRQSPPATTETILDAVRRRRRRRRLTVIAAIVAVGGAVVVPATVLTSGDDNPTSQVASDGGGQPLTDKALRLLAAADVDVMPQPAGTSVAVSREEAIGATRSIWAIWNNLPADKATATLAIVTTHRTGKELGNGQFVPNIDHELVWVIAFTDIPRAQVPWVETTRRLVTIVAFVRSDEPKLLSYVAF